MTNTKKINTKKINAKVLPIHVIFFKINMIFIFCPMEQTDPSTNALKLTSQKINVYEINTNF